MAKKNRSDSNKAYFSAYSAKAASHRERRLKRHLKAHTNDAQAAKANPANYRRQASNNKGGWLNRSQAATHDMGQGSPSIMELTRSEQKRYAQISARIRRLRNREMYDKDQKAQPPKKAA